MPPIPENQTVLITLDYLKAKNTASQGSVEFLPPRFLAADPNIVVPVPVIGEVVAGSGTVRLVPTDAGTYQVTERLDGQKPYMWHINVPPAVAGTTRSLWSFAPAQPVVQGVVLNTLLSGAGAPANGVGIDGDYYYDVVGKFWYGPKALGVWPAGFSVMGPQGEQGPPTPGAGTGVTPQLGYYVGPLGSRTTLAMAASVEYAAPLYLAAPGTLSRLGAEITVAGAGSAVIRLGVRADNNGIPGALLLDAGTVPGDAVTAAGIEISGLTLPVVPGRYWLTGTAQGGTPTVRANSGDVWPGAAPTLASAVGSASSAGYATAATVAGALPSTYTISSRTGSPPRVVARIDP